MRRSAARKKFVADRAEMIPSSLPDEIVGRDCRPWLETAGDLRRSLCDPWQVSIATRGAGNARFRKGRREA